MEAMGVKMMTMMMKRKEVLGPMGVAILLILAGCLMPLTMAQPSADVVCDRVKADIQPCLASVSPPTPPTPACCQGLKNIANLAANCVDDGLAAPNCVSKVCQCTKSSLSAQSGADFSARFTGPCMVNIGFEVDEC